MFFLQICCWVSATVLLKLYSYLVQTSSELSVSCKSETHRWIQRARRRDDGFALLQRLVPLLDVVFKGQALFAEAQRSHAELLLEAVVGRDALGIGERRVAPPGAEDGLGAVCALHALHGGHCEEQSITSIRDQGHFLKRKVLKVSISTNMTVRYGFGTAGGIN